MVQDYCSILIQKLSVDGAGTAPGNIKYFLFIETAKPWPENEKNLASYLSYAYDLAQGSLKIHFFHLVLIPKMDLPNYYFSSIHLTM